MHLICVWVLLLKLLTELWIAPRGANLQLLAQVIKATCCAGRDIKPPQFFDNEEMRRATPPISVYWDLMADARSGSRQDLELNQQFTGQNTDECCPIANGLLRFSHSGRYDPRDRAPRSSSERTIPM